jgi:hypothetical protein
MGVSVMLKINSIKKETGKNGSNNKNSLEMQLSVVDRAKTDMEMD